MAVFSHSGCFCHSRGAIRVLSYLLTPPASLRRPARVSSQMSIQLPANHSGFAFLRCPQVQEGEVMLEVHESLAITTVDVQNHPVGVEDATTLCTGFIRLLLSLLWPLFSSTWPVVSLARAREQHPLLLNALACAALYCSGGFEARRGQGRARGPRAVDHCGARPRRQVGVVTALPARIRRCRPQPTPHCACFAPR